MRAQLLADEFRVFELAFAELARCIQRFAVGGRRIERMRLEDSWMTIEPTGGTYQKTEGSRPGTRTLGRASPGGSRAERRRNLTIARREGRAHARAQKEQDEHGA